MPWPAPSRIRPSARCSRSKLWRCKKAWIIPGFFTAAFCSLLGRFAVELGQAHAGARVYVGQGVMLMAPRGAVPQPVVVLHVERQPVDDGVYVVQRINQVVAVLRLGMQHAVFLHGCLRPVTMLEAFWPKRWDEC